jgi:hypothetical protein
MTTTEPTTLAEVHRRYREIAPEPTPSNPEVARELTRRLLVSAIRRDNRLTAGILGGKALSAEDHAGLIAEFAAAHLLQEMQNNTPAIADEAAAVIAGAAQDGSVGEWVRQHAQSLGIDAGEVDRLATAEARLRAAQTGDAEKALAQNADMARTLGRIVSEMSAGLYAAWINLQRGDSGAALKWIEEMPADARDRDPETTWNGTETGAEWLARTQAPVS